MLSGKRNSAKTGYQCNYTADMWYTPLDILWYLCLPLTEWQWHAALPFRQCICKLEPEKPPSCRHTQHHITLQCTSTCRGGLACEDEERLVHRQTRIVTRTTAGNEDTCCMKLNLPACMKRKDNTTTSCQWQSSYTNGIAYIGRPTTWQQPAKPAICQQPASLHEQQHNSMTSSQWHSTYTLHEEEDQPGRQCQASPKHLSVQRSRVVTEWSHWTCLASWIGSQRAAQNLVLPIDSMPGSLCPLHEQLCCPNQAQNQAAASRLKPLSMVSASTEKQLQVIWNPEIWSLQARESNAFVQLKAADFGVLVCSDVFVWAWLQQSLLMSHL